MFRNFLRRKPAQSEKNEDRIVADVYGSMNQEYVKKLFYGGEDSAGKILKPLVRILYGEDCSITEEYTKDASFFYTQVWIRSHGGVSPEFSTPQYIKEALKQRFPGYGPKAIEKGTDLCLQFISTHEPGFIKSGPTVSEVKSTHSFSTDKGAELFLKGYTFLENGQFENAIDALRQCIKTEPQNTAGRFELAEVYLKIKDNNNAFAVLLQNVPYITSVSDKARLYRRIGFIAIETGNYPLAEAALVYSQQIEPSRSAINELMYIQQMTGKKTWCSKEQAMMLLKQNKMLFWD